MQVQVVTSQKEVVCKDFKELLQEYPQTILYFYPKDNTPGCSLEAKEFSEHLEAFHAYGIGVIGVSKDSAASHCSFISKQGLRFPLISDESKELQERYGAWGEKKNYGKTFMGTIRSTFLLNQEGEILKAWRNVKASGHVARVMKELGIE
ncbi:MAG: peroxiredoxin [candidate division SR1 bacterium]|nr:MAG: peroxiredoxin [candidate division SR1 bacterium]